MAKKNMGITVKKSEDFNEWYTQIIKKAELVDYSAVSGCLVFRPEAYQIWENIKSVVDKRYKELGIKNVYFPLLIPEKFLNKEKDHVEGFSPEVAWVTYAGNTKLDERLAVRPTSETIMYPSYSQWIRSWRDLPLRCNQWNNVVRWEFKHPVPFLRTREFLWSEGHTVFATKEEAEKEISEILNIYNDVLKDFLALAGITGQKSEKEKFAGAVYTKSIELMMPNGKAIQGPDAHYDGTNFAKAFDIKFKDKDSKEKFAHQNTWAITTRMIGVMIAIHGDDHGVVLPPRIAPTQIVIVPILFEDSKEKVIKFAESLRSKLKKFSVYLDDRENYSPGYKFNEWEMKGIPVRIEVGPKDVEKNSVVVVMRDTLKKHIVDVDNISEFIADEMDLMHERMYKNSKKILDESIAEAENIDLLVEGIKNRKMVLAPFCGEPECEDFIKEKTGGAGTRNYPADKNTSLPGKKCVYCGKEAKYMAYFAKSY